MVKIINQDIINEIINQFMADKYMSIRKLSHKYNLSYKKIRKILNSNNINSSLKQNIGSYRYSNDIINQIIIKYLNNNISIKQLAEEYNIAASTIARWLKQCNINIANGAIFSKIPLILLENAANYYKNNDTSVKIAAQKFNIGKNSLLQYLQTHNLIKPKRQNLSYDRSKFHNLDTEEKMYWFGFIMADGCVIDNDKTKEYRLNIVLAKKDKDHLEKFLQFMNAPNVQIKERICYKNNKEFKAVQVRLSSKELVKDLVSHGCVQRKTYNGFLKNEDFENIDNQLIMAFLRGYIDGDGTIYKNYHRLLIVVHNKNIMLFLVNLIKLVNIMPHIHFIKNGNGLYQISLNKKDDFFSFCKQLYKNATIYMNRKFNNYLMNKFAV